ncbi:MAG: glycosyl hydrolase family 5 [Rhodospirillaceae bacterium TMED256]|nr:MAG: glycosyl hydrolase family 5 [Rhodospirillaceae bacterium TMED256]
MLLCLIAVESSAIEGKAVVLQGLDKVTARVSTIEVAIGDTVRFGSLQIVPRACGRTPPEEPPESTVYLDITDLRPGGAPLDLFHGWMFASSPALNALEHPVYDVWVLECKVLVGDEVQQR